MRQCHVVVGAFVVALVWGGIARAQDGDGIPVTIRTATSALNSGDQKTITDFIDKQVGRLIEGDPQTSADARNRLVDPFNQGPSETFITFYDSALCPRLLPATKAKTIWARLNAQLVARSLRGEGAVAVIKEGLADKTEAVFYASLVAARGFTGNDKVAQPAKEALLAALLAAMKDEQRPFLLEHLYVAVVEVGKAEAIDAVLNKINQRIAVHLRDPETLAESEYLGIRRALTKMVNQNIAATSDNRPELAPKEKSLVLLMVVAVRYLDLVTQSEMKKETKEINRSVYPQIQFSANEALQWASPVLVKNYNFVIKAPKDIKGLPLPDVRLILTEWKEVLTQTLSVKPPELQLQAPAPPVAPAPPAPKPDTTVKP